MSKYIPGNQKHLTLNDRIYIENELAKGTSFKDIATFLCKDPTTISKVLTWQDLTTENNLTATFKNVKKKTYYAGLHAFNRTSEDGKKVFSQWSNVKKVTVKQSIWVNNTDS